MTTMHSQKYDYAKLGVISELVVDNIDDICNALDIKVRHDGKRLCGACPIHGGHNKSAFQMYKTGNSVSGSWSCYTRSCQKIFLPTPIGFVRGVLSAKNGWGCRSDSAKVVPFGKAVEWILRFLNKDYNSIQISEEDLDKKRFISQSNILSRERTVEKTIHKRQVREKLAIPSSYFIKRGFSEEILDRFDVGECIGEGKEMSWRSVVPVYDDSGQYLVGCTGRSVYEKCPKCCNYHNETFSCQTDTITKWKHSANFNADNYLYNWWNAKEFIKATGVVILVESPANVWRLEEAGILNSVGMFGAYLKSRQKYLLDTSGALSILYIRDQDEAGLAGATHLKELCSRTYRLYFPDISANDIAEMSTDSITEEIRPIFDKVKESLLTFTT